MQARGSRDRIIEQAIGLARDAAPDLTAILITHYPDVETLDTYRPGETDLAGAEMGPSGWAELVALPVALPPSNVPEAAALRDGLLEAGVLPATVDVRFLPGWRSPETLDGLEPATVRPVLIDMVAGAEPNDLPPADEDDLARKGFGFLLGLQVDWSIPLWDEVAANGPPQEPEEQETPVDAAQAAAFDRWRSAAFEAAGCGPRPGVRGGRRNRRFPGGRRATPGRSAQRMNRYRSHLPAARSSFCLFIRALAASRTASARTSSVMPTPSR
jgi:hypothetical protein